MSSVQHDGVDLYYREVGTGTPVLLIHGTGADADLWGAGVDLLAATHRVIVYDRRGYSRSTHDRSGNHNTHADDAAALLQAIGGAPALIVGWSTGGVIALALALRHPDLVAGLVLEEPPLFAKRDFSWDVPRRLLPILLLGKLGRTEQAVRRFNRWHLSSGGTSYEQLPLAWRHAMERNSAAVLAEIADGTGERVLTAEQIGTIQYPVTGLLGEYTLPYLRRCMRRISQLLPQTAVVTIAGGNHAMHLDNPQAWTAAIRAADARTPESEVRRGQKTAT